MATSKKKTVKKKSAATAKKKTVKKKAVTKKIPVKKTVKKKSVKKKIGTKKITPKSSKIKVTHEQLHKMICEAAYYISLERDYDNINPTEDWLKAEAAIKKICTVHTS